MLRPRMLLLLTASGTAALLQAPPAALPAAAAAEHRTAVHVGGPIFTVLPAFNSFTLDSARVCSADMELPPLGSITTARMALLSEPGLVIRHGGSWSDNEELLEPGKPLLPPLTPTPTWLGPGCNLSLAKWSLLKRFVSRINASLVFGVNSLTRLHADPAAAIDLSNADLLFQLETSPMASPAPLIGFVRALVLYLVLLCFPRCLPVCVRFHWLNRAPHSSLAQPNNRSLATSRRTGSTTSRTGLSDNQDTRSYHPKGTPLTFARCGKCWRSGS